MSWTNWRTTWLPPCRNTVTTSCSILNYLSALSRCTTMNETRYKGKTSCCWTRRTRVSNVRELHWAMRRKQSFATSHANSLNAHWNFRKTCSKRRMLLNYIWQTKPTYKAFPTFIAKQHTMRPKHVARRVGYLHFTHRATAHLWCMPISVSCARRCIVPTIADAQRTMSSTTSVSWAALSTYVAK